MRQQYNAIKTQLQAIPTPYPNAHEELRAQQLQAQYNRLYDERKQTLQQINTARQEFANANTNIGTATAEANTAQTALNTADRNRQNEERLYNYIQGRNTDRYNKISEFKNARARIQELTDQIDRRNQIVNEWDSNHKNLHDELLQFWDFLETGRDSKTGNFYNRFTLSKKQAQKQLDNTKHMLFQQYQRGYTMAA